jgi:voltage-gated potassium channel
MSCRRSAAAQSEQPRHWLFNRPERWQYACNRGYTEATDMNEVHTQDSLLEDNCHDGPEVIAEKHLLRRFRLLALLFLTVLLIVSSTVFFRWAEGWTWVDAYFFTVVTISTVGYGVLVPATVLGKIATTILIFSGIGIVAATIEHVGSVLIDRRARKLALRIRARRRVREKG